MGAGPAAGRPPPRPQRFRRLRDRPRPRAPLTPAKHGRPLAAEGGSITFALLIEYDGADFAGWQAQAGQASIAGALADALAELTGHAGRRVGCAGRTDAGVHARAQLAEVVLPAGDPGGVVARAGQRPARLAAGLNHFLPASIRVHRAWTVPAGFTARRAAAGKIYRYAIYLGPEPPALGAGGVWHRRRPLDLAAMRAAAGHLTGAHDFEAFRHAHCQAPHARRRIGRIRCRQRRRPPVGRLLTIELTGDAFCRHMCRIIVGTLVEVGAGLRAADSMPDLLAGRDRRRTGVTAPAHGLTLWRVLLRAGASPPAATAPASTGRTDFHGRVHSLGRSRADPGVGAGRDCGPMPVRGTE